MTADHSTEARLDPVAFVGSLATTTLRFGAGIATEPRSARPPLLLELYEFEACPFCRIVREVLTELDLDALIRPCPKGGTRYRDELLKVGGKAQFPFLVDPNTGESMYESADIIVYLYEQYGGGERPLRWRAIGLQQLWSGIAGTWRFGAGRDARPSIMPAQPLELYSFEGSPFARLVRERLCELELPYVLRSMGRSAAADWLPPVLRDAMKVQGEPQTLNRRVLLERAGRITVPYLVDPNFGVEMGETAAIIEHLESHYAAR
ncbi:MAG TPA: glutathione S-transferase N-terminal domain-containing protein [Pseudomonadales bacterium]|nr:glutathione S-transferase N-terminal domain-containing protein [Pseudomonadales bacterium]